MVNKVEKRIDNSGNVTLMLNDHEENSTNIYVFGALISTEGKVRNFKQMVEFDAHSKKDIMKIINKKESLLQNLLQNEIKHQKNLPKNFQDNTKIKVFNKKLADLEERKYKVVGSELFDNDLLVVMCGRFIQYCPMNDDMFNDDIDSEIKLSKMNINFGPQVEIMKIWPT